MPSGNDIQNTKKNVSNKQQYEIILSSKGLRGRNEEDYWTHSQNKEEN
jgi:hypothetical protein